MTGNAPSRLLADEDIAKIKEANPILDVVNEHVTMKRVGSSYKGLCPFHDERTPSFNVNPATGTYHCFGCGKSGDVITFISEIEGGGFRHAALQLADRGHVDIVGASDTDAKDRELRTRIIEANEAAAVFYTNELFANNDAQAARELLAKRGFTAAHAREFECGYAPRGRNTLVTVLTDSGFTPEELEAAGLARRTNRGDLNDVFQGRLLWTIRSEFDKAIGFGARRLYDDDWQSAKFINTTETPVYRKSDVLFGYNKARRTISTKRHAIVVEGYTDVMACHIAGVTNAVATCGTSFTKEHLRTLRRIVGESGELTFGLDDDNAGRKASLSVYDLAHNLVPRLTALPPTDGLDPDELRQARGDDAVVDAVSRRRPLIAAVIDAKLAPFLPIDTPEDKTIAVGEVAPLLGHISDPIVRSDYISKVATQVGVTPSDIASRMSGVDQVAPPPELPVEEGTPSQQKERHIIGVLAQHEGAARAAADAAAPLMQSAEAVAAIHAIQAAFTGGFGNWFDRVCAHADDDTRGFLINQVSTGLPVSADKMTVHATELVDQLAKIRESERAQQMSTQIATMSDPDEKARALRALVEAVRKRNASK